MSLIQAIRSQVEAALWECCPPEYIHSIEDTALVAQVVETLADDARAFARKDPAA
jgi:hypothetical protein